MPSRRRLLTLFASLLFAAPAAIASTAIASTAIAPTAGATTVTAATGPLPVVASFSILGDMVGQVGGERVRVATLVGPDGDAHVYQPTPADARAVASAKVVFVNGLGFEGWIDRLIKAAGFRGPVVVVSRGIRPESTPDAGGDDHDHGHDGDAQGHGGGDHHHDGIDPHAWQSVTNAERYVRNIAEALIAADPAGRAVYEANAARYLAALAALDAEIRQAFAALPPGRRTVITSHDAFGYFGQAYGIAFVAPVGVSTESEASAADVAKLIRQIREQKIPAVFMENVSDPRLLEQISRETGARVGGKLHSDALSAADGPAASYIEMMRHNVRTLTASLGS